MCFRCGLPAYRPCGCNTINYPQQYSPCANPGPCPTKLDAQCVIYHLQNNTITELINLGLGNGATLELILNTIDTYIGQVKPATWNLPCLRDPDGLNFTINNLQQFSEAVDVTLCNLQDQIDTLAETASLPITVNDTLTVHINASGTLNHTLSADVQVSEASGNTLAIIADGLVVPAQTLQPDYDNKQLGISNGNTINMSGFFCDTIVWLGNVATDPVSASDGQYWYNTTSTSLKIKVNGTVKTISIT